MENKTPIVRPQLTPPLTPRPLPPRSRRSSGTTEEISNLRCNMLKIGHWSTESSDLDESLALLNVIVDALRSLAFLIRRHATLISAGEPIAQEIETGLTSILRDVQSIKSG